jgi:hypothetical protein
MKSASGGVKSDERRTERKAMSDEQRVMSNEQRVMSNEQ